MSKPLILARAALPAGKNRLAIARHANPPCAIVIPARNEQSTVGEIVAAAKRALVAEVIVVDDASTDATADAARSAGATVLSLTQQLGAWGATQTGIRYALRRGYGRAVTLDADGQHNPGDIHRLLKPLSSESADVTIGAYPDRTSRARKIAFSYFRLLTGFTLTDITSGFRAYNHAAMNVLASPSATLLDYQDVGVLLLLRRNGLHIEEVRVQMRPRSNGKSRVFSSWLEVTRYLVQTTMICIAGLGSTRRRPRVT